MIRVVLTSNLQKYYPEREFEIEAQNILALLAKMDLKRPLFSSYIIEDGKTVRKHVNIFVNGAVLKDKSRLTDTLKDGTTIHIMQALSGG